MIGRLVLGLSGLLFLTFMTLLGGVGGFLFTIGLYAVIAWAVAARHNPAGAPHLGLDPNARKGDLFDVVRRIRYQNNVLSSLKSCFSDGRERMEYYMIRYGLRAGLSRYWAAGLPEADAILILAKHVLVSEIGRINDNEVKERISTEVEDILNNHEIVNNLPISKIIAGTIYFVGLLYYGGNISADQHIAFIGEVEAELSSASSADQS